MPRRVACLTCNDSIIATKPGLLEIVRSELARLQTAMDPFDIELVSVPWDANLDWASFDATIIRTTWDYYKRGEEYKLALQTIAALCPLYNPLKVVMWNMNKRYIPELGKKGVNVVPTLFFEEPFNPSECFTRLNSNELVAKPALSAGAFNTVRFSKDSLLPDFPMEQMLATGGMLVQPLMNAIQKEGEVSFLFFGGTFSHSVIKKAKDGDFRIQSQFGGTVEPYTASKDAIAWAEGVLEHVPPCLYARVDAVFQDSKWWLMELELIEPQLFLRADEKAASRFAAALSSRLD